jgi:hypothetical protein
VEGPPVNRVHFLAPSGGLRWCRARGRGQGGAPYWTNDLDRGEDRHKMLAAEGAKVSWFSRCAAPGPAPAPVVAEAGVGCAGARPYLGARSQGRCGCGDMMIDGVPGGEAAARSFKAVPCARARSAALQLERAAGIGGGQMRAPGLGRSDRGEGLVTEGAQGVVRPADHLAGHR